MNSRTRCLNLTLMALIAVAGTSLRSYAQQPRPNPMCVIDVQENLILDANQHPLRNEISIVAKTTSRRLAQYSTVVGTHGINWKEFWKFRKKASSSCEDFLEQKEKESNKIYLTPTAKPAPGADDAGSHSEQTGEGPVPPETSSSPNAIIP